MLNTAVENISNKLKLIGLMAPLVVGFNAAGIILCIYVLFTLGDSIIEKSGIAMIEEVRAGYEEFGQIEELTRSSMKAVEDLDQGIGTSMSESELLAVTEIMMTSETNAQLFLRLLKVNIYNLAGQIPGTASWYEIHAPVIDGTIERSRARQLELLKIKSHYNQGA